jgi:hypothetical protein
MVIFTCGHCGALLECTLDEVGSSQKCPQCARESLVSEPTPSTTETQRRRSIGRIKTVFFVLGTLALVLLLVAEGKTALILYIALGADMGLAFFLAPMLAPKATAVCPKCGNNEALASRRGFMPGAVIPNKCGECGHEWIVDRTGDAVRSVRAFLQVKSPLDKGFGELVTCAVHLMLSEGMAEDRILRRLRGAGLDLETANGCLHKAKAQPLKLEIATEAGSL